jgi:hypothetical protein
MSGSPSSYRDIGFLHCKGYIILKLVEYGELSQTALVSQAAAVVSVGDAVGVILCLLPPDDIPNTMSLIPYTIKVLYRYHQGPKEGTKDRRDQGYAREITTTSAPRPTLWLPLTV